MIPNPITIKGIRGSELRAGDDGGLRALLDFTKKRRDVLSLNILPLL
jgi:hypothetical protein